MKSKNVKRKVFRNLDSARENGAFEVDGYLFGATADEIADDMAALAADVEGLDREVLAPHVQAWLDERASQ